MTPSDRDLPLPGDPGLPEADGPSDALLAAALRALDEEAAEAPGTDPSRIAGHLAGPGDGGVIAAAAASPRVRELLADLVACEPDAARAAASGAEALPAALRERLLRARPEPVAPAPVLPMAPRRARLGRVAAAAAILLATGTVLAVSRADAGPSLPVEGIDRVASSGAVVSEGAGRLPLGARLRPGAAERLALRLPGGGRVVLGEADALRVARDAVGGAAALALEAGDAVVSARAGAPVLLLLPDGVRVLVEEGAARVAAGASAVLSLVDGARASVTPSAGAAVALAGPASVRLDAAPAQGDDDPAATAAAEASIRRDLEFFGGPVRPPETERVVSSRRFRALPAAGPAAPPRPRRSDVAGLPAIRLDLAGGPEEGAAAVAWRPDEASAAEPRVLALLVVRGPPAGSPPATLAVDAMLGSAEGASGSPAAGGGTTVTVGGEAGPLRVPLAIARADAGADLVLSFRARGGAVTVWFEGIAFPPAGAVPAQLSTSTSTSASEPGPR